MGSDQSSPEKTTNKNYQQSQSPQRRYQQTVNHRTPSPPQQRQYQVYQQRPQQVVNVTPSLPPPQLQKRQETVPLQQAQQAASASLQQQTLPQQRPQQVVNVTPSLPPPQPQKRQETVPLQQAQQVASASLQKKTLPQQQPQQVVNVTSSLPPPQPQQHQETVLLQQTQQAASASLQQKTLQPQRQRVVDAGDVNNCRLEKDKGKMASLQQKNKSYNMTASTVAMLDCPVCMETMCAPILQCKRGHSLCNTCTTALRDGLCPICRDVMTGMRNFTLEEVVAEIKFDCPNKPCIFKIKRSDMDDHLKECIYRQMPCPMGAATGKCSWTGSVQDMLAHFEERHPANRVKLGENFKLHNLKADEDERLVFLTNHGIFLFIITLRIDTLQKMCYFVIQHIGSRKVAHSFFYEIQIFSQVDSRRQIIFKDNCFSDVMKADEVYQLGECAMLPLTLLPHFLKNKMFSFCLSLARQGGPNNHRSQDQRPSSSDSNSSRPPRSGPNERGNNFKPRGRPHSKGPQDSQHRKWTNAKNTNE